MVAYHHGTQVPVIIGLQETHQIGAKSPHRRMVAFHYGCPPLARKRRLPWTGLSQESAPAIGLEVMIQCY